MKQLLTFGIIGVAVYGFVRVLRMKNLSDELQTGVKNPRIHKVDWNGITLRADALISNPTKDSITISKPFVTLSSNGKQLATSTPENKHTTIQPLANTTIEAIEIPLAWTALSPYIADIVGKIPSLIKSLKGKQVSVGKLLNIPLEMTFSTYADTIFIKSQPVKLN